jgi:hypothetical protein
METNYFKKFIYLPIISTEVEAKTSLSGCYGTAENFINWSLFPTCMANYPFAGVREVITGLFMDVAKDYMQRVVVYDFQLHQERDVHAFLRLHLARGKVIHLQGYPSLSFNSKEGVVVMARLMDYATMMEYRKNVIASRSYDRENEIIGNEGPAVIQAFQNFKPGERIPIKPKILEEMLEKNVPLLKNARPYSFSEHAPEIPSVSL